MTIFIGDTTEIDYAALEYAEAVSMADYEYVDRLVGECLKQNPDLEKKERYLKLLLEENGGDIQEALSCL